MARVTTANAENEYFDRGYLICLSNLINMYGQGTEAEELMLALGASEDRIKSMGFSDYDSQPLLDLRRLLDAKCKAAA